MQFDLAPWLERHKRIGLQLSGGKDSLACLYLLKPWWDKLSVYWLNTGDAFPEMIERMSAIGAMLPHYKELKGRQPETIAAHGWPSDVVPARYTTLGNMVHGPTMFKVQPRLDCCWNSLMEPMHRAMTEDRITLVIRGKRHDDDDKTQVYTGSVDPLSGIELLFPIYDWTEDETYAYLQAQGVELPSFYKYINTAMDCKTCTAWWPHQHVRYLHAEHPELYKITQRRTKLIRLAVEREMSQLNEV